MFIHNMFYDNSITKKNMYCHMRHLSASSRTMKESRDKIDACKYQ